MSVHKSFSVHILHSGKIVGEWKSLEVLCLLAELSTSPGCTLAAAKKCRGTAVKQSDLPLLPSALHSHEPKSMRNHQEKGLSPASDPLCSLQRDTSQVWTWQVAQTTLQILELLSNNGGLQFDTVRGCKEKGFKRKRPKALGNKKYDPSGYKSLSFWWVHGNDSRNHHQGREDDISGNLLSVL